MTIELDDAVAETVRQIAAAQQRSEKDIVRDALAAFAQAKRPLPKGIGKYHSGQRDVSQKARDILRDAVKDGIWP